jgi:putative transposase
MIYHRKTPVHHPPLEIYNRPVVIFVTVRTDKHKPILCHDVAHRLIVEAWEKADSWLVGRYVLMPEHIHLFCAPRAWDSPSLTNWVQYWKALVTRNWLCRKDLPIWQKSFWDRQLRTGDRYGDKWQYMLQNPVRRGLVSNPDKWKYQGEMHVLQW